MTGDVLQCVDRSPLWCVKGGVGFFFRSGYRQVHMAALTTDQAHAAQAQRDDFGGAGYRMRRVWS